MSSSIAPLPGEPQLFLETTDVASDRANAQALAVSEYAHGSIGAAGDTDMFAVSVVAGTTYYIEMHGEGLPLSARLIDSTLTLYDESGAEIGFNDDARSSTFGSFIAWTADYTGTLYVEGAGYQTVTGNYALSVQEEVQSAIDTAARIVVGEEVSGHLTSGGSGDSDWYRIELTAGTDYTIGAQSGGTVFVNILDANGIPLSVPSDAPFVFTPDADGTYFVEVIGNPAPGSEIFTLEVSTGSGGSSSTSPLDSITWNYIAPATINVFFAGADLSVNDSLADLLPFGTAAWSPEAQASAEAAFGNFSAVTNLVINFVTDIATADFVMFSSLDAIGDPNTIGYWGIGGGAVTIDDVGYSLDGWGVFNASSNIITAGLDQGSYGYYVLLHEMAHGFGMAHPHDQGGGSTVMTGVTSPFGSYGAFELNQGVFTVMSYTPTWRTGPFTPASLGYGYSGTLMALDIAVLQAKYGARAANTGDDVYELPAGNGSGTFYSAIWDTGGVDSIVYNGSAAATISLVAATLDYSPYGGGRISYSLAAQGGFTIANGVVIENATGGSGSDFIEGNGVANILDGADGSDIVLGGDGDDTITGGSGEDVLSGDGGADTITGGEGDDFIVIDAEDDYAGGAVQGGNGNDTLVFDTPFTKGAFDLAGLLYSTGSFEQYAIAMNDDAGDQPWDMRFDVFDLIGSPIGWMFFNDDGTIEKVIQDAETGQYDYSIGFSNLDPAGQATISLGFQGSAGNDRFVLGSSAFQQLGLSIVDGGDGNDTFTVAAGFNATGAWVNGGNGNDRLIWSAGVNLNGMEFAGGANFDTLEISAGGTRSLSGLVLTSVESIQLTNAAGTLLVLSDNSQAALVTAANGDSDTVNLASAVRADVWSSTGLGLLQQLLAAGVEQIAWSGGWDGDSVATARFGGGIVVYSDDTTGQPWLNKETGFDSAGALDYETRVFDDGRESTTDYQSGVKVSYEVVDVDNVWSFQSQLKTFHANGRVASDTTVFDAGAPLRSQGYAYDDTGLRTSMSQELNDGRMLTLHYDASGATTSRLVQDTDNAFNWTSKQTFFDGSGNVTTQRDVYDTGNVIAQGRAGNDTIVGGAFNDTLFGGAGADIFVYGAGTDRIRDYSQSDGDQLDLSLLGISDLAGLEALATLRETAAALFIDFGAGNTLRIDGLQAADLSDSDFFTIV